MPELTQQEYQKMLQIGTVDVGNNTLFAKNQKVAIDKNHLTLVISSGGSGASAIKEAIRTAQQKLEDDFSRYMKFVLVDSAENEITGAENQMGHSILKTFNISEEGAQERIEYTNRQGFFRTWVPKNYDFTQLNKNGSGRDRMTAKIKFYDNSEGTYVDVKFRQLIRSFYESDWATMKNLPVDIMILAGLSGGNGSGTYLELAAHTRKACMDAGVTGDIRVFGYLFLPDVVENFEQSNLDVQNQLYTNGYAALKELESYMELPFEGERKETFDSRDGVTSITFDGTRSLYNYPVLISGDYKETKSMMAECIINLALDNNGTFDQNSFYSNTQTMRMNYLQSATRLNAGLLTPDFFPEDSHRYAGIGYAYAAIPEKIITANIVSNVCKKLYQPDPMKPGNKTCFCTTKSDSRLSHTEMEQVVRRLLGLSEKNRVTEQSFWYEKLQGKLNQLSTLSENTREITKEEIRSGKTEGYKQGFNRVEKATQGKAGLRDHLKLLLETFQQNAEQVLKEYGPRVMEYLYTGKGPDDKDGNPQFFLDLSIQKMLEFARKQFHEIVADGKRGVEPSNEIPSGLKEMILKKKLNQWKTDFHAAVQYQVKQEIAKSAIEMQGSWEAMIETPIQMYVEQCTTFAERIESLADFYQSEGNSLEDATYDRFVEVSQTDNCINLCNDVKVFNWVKDQVGKKIQSIPVEEVKTDLIDAFVANPKAWITTEEGVTRKAFDGVMAKSCKLGIGAVGGGGLSLTATEYFDYVLAQVDAAQVQDTAHQLIVNIVDRLLQKSKPSIHMERQNPSVNRFLMIPASLQGSPFGAAIIAAFTNRWNAIGGSNMALSPSVSDIVCYQTSVANAVCDLSDIKKWESAYNKSKSPSIHLSNGEYGTSYVERTKTEIDRELAVKTGVAAPVSYLTPEEDIIFGTGLSWRHYPPLDLKNVSANASEAEFMREIFNPVVDFALEEGIIERQVVTQNTYQYVIHMIPEDWKNLDVSAYNQKNAQGEYLLGEPLFQYLKSLNPLGTQENDREVRLTGSGYFDVPFDFTDARNAGGGKTLAVIEDISLQYMKRILRRNTWLFLELRNTLNRYYVVYQEMKEKVRSVEEVTKVNNFIKYFQYGLITEAEGKWYLDMDSKGISKRVFAKFGDLDTLDYTPFETKLKKDWKIILAISKLTKQDFAALENLLKERLLDLPQEEVDQMKVANIKKLLPYAEEIDEQFAKKWPNRELAGAVEKELEPVSEAEWKYVNLIVTLREKLEELQETPDPIPKTILDDQPVKDSEPVSEDTWDCPNPECGQKGNTTAFCPGCGTKRPVVQKPEDTWDCPNPECGRKGNTTPFCPGCGTKRPIVQKPEDTWDCLCGQKGNKTAFCPNCGRPRPAEKKDTTWNCGCGNTGITTDFCPNCGNRR